ncbi:MAG: hypothetical protein IKT70_04560 [Clostridia bacterium]|nr:hypothetical protein [Clostridia bacterium]
MKKVLLLSILVLAFLFTAACGEASDNIDAPVDGNDDTTAVEAGNINPGKIRVKTVEGLNEHIYMTFFKPESDNYTVSYRLSGTDKFTEIDKELIIEDGNSLECYILGLAKGRYDVRIECGEGDNFARATIASIDVEKQDRSGYASFNREEGIGGYNSDGTVKDGAKIIYLTNANKNTVTLDIGGTTYTGIVEILKANKTMAEPLIIRVMDNITTNQWTPSEEKIRQVDFSAADESYFAGLFSDQYGDNVAGLTGSVSSKKEGKLYQFITTADGIKMTETVDAEIASDGCGMNMLEIYDASNITIEGIGEKAGFFQFGVAFYYSDSIEIKNLTIEQYPVNALGFYALDKADVHGGYWIHHNTFTIGNNTWGIGSSRTGEETIEMVDVNSITVSYNKFDQVAKAATLGDADGGACIDITFHHNYYNRVEQSVPFVRNTNMHSYNNYYERCFRAISPRTNSYVFGEANYFQNCSGAYYISGGESWGTIKSFNEVYVESGGTAKISVVSDRSEFVENTCMPDGKTDYSKFDTDAKLFYYDVSNKKSDVELMHDVEELADFVKVYAGAGVSARMMFK